MKASWQRRRRSNAMKKSWKRRNGGLEPTNSNEQTNRFDQLEQLVITWRALENHQKGQSSTPQLEQIIQATIDRIRLEIILLCQQWTYI